MVEKGIPGAKLLLKLRTNIDVPISAILTFNQVANNVGATIFGALVGNYFGDSEWVLVGSGLTLTILLLIFSEIIPKTLGVMYASEIAPRAAYPIQGLVYMLYPLVKLSSFVTQRMRVAGEEPKTVTQEDLIAQAEIARAEGTITERESRWIANGLRLNEQTAHELMTPRTVVYRLPDEMPLSMVTAHSEHWTHSRLPLCKDNDPDKVVGLVYRREVFDALATKSDEELAATPISALSHEVEFIPETLPGDEILTRFLKTRQHLFIVINEHGGMEGLITLEDVLENLLGEEIVDHHDQHVDMQEFARRVAQKRREGKKE